MLEWHQNLDQQRRYRRLLLRVRQDQPERRHARHQRLHRRCEHAGSGRLAPYPCDGASPAGDAAVQRLHRARHGAAGRRKRRLQAGHAHAGHLPRIGGRRGPGHGAPRVGRGCAPRPPAPHVRPDARRLSAHAGQDRRDGRAGGQRRAAHLPRGLAARHRPGARHRRSSHGQDDRHRKRPACDRHGAAVARRAGRGSGQQGRVAVPRHPLAAHLRRRDRGAATDHRQGRSAGANA